MSPRKRSWATLFVALGLMAGPQARTQSDQSISTLHDAARTGQRELVTALLNQNANVNARNDRDQTPLHLGALGGEMEIIKLLVERHADLNATDADGFTPLHYAVIAVRPEVVGFLLTNKARVNAQANVKRWTPLHFAVLAQEKEIVQLLLSNQANPNAADARGRTPLHQTTSKADVAMARLLLAHGADLNRPLPHNGQTALHLAAAQGDQSMVQFLLDHGANANAQDKDGKTAIERAIQNEQTQTAQILWKHAGKPALSKVD